jgi:hypothetical protein
MRCHGLCPATFVCDALWRPRHIPQSVMPQYCTSFLRSRFLCFQINITSKTVLSLWQRFCQTSTITAPTSTNPRRAWSVIMILPGNRSRLSPADSNRFPLLERLREFAVTITSEAFLFSPFYAQRLHVWQCDSFLLNLDKVCQRIQ